MRTIRCWAERWRSRAVPWLASVVQEAYPQSVLPMYLAEEAPPGPRRVVAEDTRWLDALEGQGATNVADDDVRGWAWADLSFTGRMEWF